MPGHGRKVGREMALLLLNQLILLLLQEHPVLLLDMLRTLVLYPRGMERVEIVCGAVGRADGGCLGGAADERAALAAPVVGVGHHAPAAVVLELGMRLEVSFVKLGIFAR